MARSPAPSLMWFRDDLRAHDNPALRRAAAAGPTVCAFVLEEDAELRPLGGASRWWVHGSLEALDRELRARGGGLLFFQGRSREIVPRLAGAVGAGRVVWNHRYGPGERALDDAIAAALEKDGRTVERFPSRLLREPWDLRSSSGGPVRTFKSYWSKLRAAGPVREPEPAPGRVEAAAIDAVAAGAVPLAALRLEPTRPDWAGGMRETWVRGEAAARARLAQFVDERLLGYGTGRNAPGQDGSSRLSPRLRFGELSPATVFAAARHAAESSRKPGIGDDVDRFLSEIAWRDYSYHLLHHYPELPTRHAQPRFDAFPFREAPDDLARWQRGETGYPVVDAGLRQLWRTGWMHNRVRMIAASFLVKHLLVDWRRGEEWFWDTLVDADPANNAVSWQWVAGSGIDASPFFRVFNPVLQGEKFDADGAYVREHVPELARLPAGVIHRPWEADAATLRRAGVELGRTYPRPIVVHEHGRQRALDALKTLRASAAAAA